MSFAEIMTANTIYPDGDSSSQPEGVQVALKCIYDSSSQYTRLYWYRKYPNEGPQYLLFKTARSNSPRLEKSDPRYTSRTGEKFTELIINNLTLADSALYYCAVSSPVV